MSAAAGSRLPDPHGFALLSEIEDVAAQLQGSAELDRDFVGLVDLTVELLELCRSMQRTYLSQAIAEHFNGSDTATVGSGSDGR